MSCTESFFIIWLLSVCHANINYYVFGFKNYLEYAIDAFIFSPIIFILILAWIIFYDKRMENPEDGYYCFIRDFLDKKIIFSRYNDFLLGSLLKIIFIPFMYSATMSCLYKIYSYNFYNFNAIVFIEFLFYFGLGCDLLIALGGYLVCSKYFSTETMSMDKTWTGWLACLLCYAPLFYVVNMFTRQVDKFIWTDWLSQEHFLYWIWALFITITWLIYWLATFSFGLRFANLSWRGLVNTGVYRYVKHPAYLSKNIYWWMHTVPWFGVVGWDILKNILALSIISTIYYWRAKTEERHLMKFEEYREYSRWIEKNGWWAKIKKNLKRVNLGLLYKSHKE